MERPSEFTRLIDERLQDENLRFLQETPRASHLTDAAPLDAAYYVRHRIETIKRIRMTARTDALALAAMTVEDYDAARVWARYVCEELDHDRMFYADLAKQRVCAEDVAATPLFQATRDLEAYLLRRIAEDGSLAAVAYSVFVEWNSERFSRTAVEKARRAFGDSAVAGSSSHLSVDETEDHSATMINLAERLTATPARRTAFLADLTEVSALFRSYFLELHEFTASLAASRAKVRGR